MTDALGNVTTYTYDEMDRVLTVTDARGGVTTYTYTDRSDVATETDAEGFVISYEYDGNKNMVKKTTVDGVTTYEYDALDRLVETTTPDGKSEILEYNGEGQIIGSTDKGGHKTSYKLDANGNVIETIDALGNSALFEYDLMGNLVKTSLHRVDTQDKVDEWEITLYEFDGRSLTTKQVDALGNVITYTYDGNGNLKTKTDADGKITTYSYNKIDMVTNINYNGGKQVTYQYNKVGDLVEMTDWTGKTSFEVDLLNRITKTTDTKGNVVSYTYDEVGNQTSVSYPDGTTATKTYDLVQNLKTVTETDGRTTSYTYDGMRRTVEMEYPHGWVETYHYDSIGQLLKVEDTDPSRKDMKQQKHVYTYDDCGNMTYEYMRGNGTGEATVENFYTYDALHRVIGAKENYGHKTRTYQYDSLGNLTWETNSNNVTVDYKLNNLNQITTKSSDGWKTQTTFTYDGRGNLVKEVYGKNKKVTTIGEYTYDETNKMVKGINANAESSAYLYNGLDALVENTWIIAKNGYGYHDVDPETQALAEDAGIETFSSGKKDNSGKKPSDKPTGSDVKKTSTVVKQFVVDYTTETFEPLMEHEVNGLDYRYVYGNDRLSVNITGVENGSSKLIENGNQIRLYYHMDYLGTADYLTSPLTGKVESWTHYNEWGEITHNAVLKCGQRELDMVKRYATHDYDSVLNMYYAKARFYDAENRRFAGVDPVLEASQYSIKGYTYDLMQLVQYLYVANNPLIYVDYLGEEYELYVKEAKSPYRTLAEGILSKDRFADEGYYGLREVAEIINQANGYTATVDYDKDANMAKLTVSNDKRTQTIQVSIDSLDRGWFKEGNKVGVSTEKGRVYFTYMSCPFNSTTYVNVDDLGDYLGLSLIVVDTNNPSENNFVSYRLVGVGVQVEVDGSVLSGGAEVVFFTDEDVRGSHLWYQPYMYLYGGGSYGGELKNAFSSLLKDPSILLNKGANITPSASAAVFAIFGNDEFTSAESYRGLFQSASVTINHVKGYVSWSNTCVVGGLGYYSTSAFGASVSATTYDLLGDGVLLDDVLPLANQTRDIGQDIELPAA